MPYILKEDRKGRKAVGLALGKVMRNGGDLQYMLAVAIQTYLEKTGLRYGNCEDIMGALTGANAEFIRCIVAPYEKQKALENGGVYSVKTITAKK